MNEHEERDHGILATAARYAETAFSVIAAGPSTYAKVDLGPRYSTPAEFLIITLVINGLASLGLHTAVASAVDESRTAEHVSSLSLAALASIAAVLVWAFAAAWAARLSGRRIPRDVLWRVSCYTTAFTLLVIPVTNLWLASLDLFSDDDVSDQVRYLLPSLPILVASVVAFIRGVIQGFEGRRVRFVLVFLMLAFGFPALVMSVPYIPAFGTFIGEHSQPSLNTRGRAIESLRIGSMRGAETNYSSFAIVQERRRFQLLIDVQNLSGVPAHNVNVRVDGPFLRSPQRYVFYSSEACANCRENLGRAELFWESRDPLVVRRLTAVMFRNFDYKKQLPLPNGQTADALFSDVGLRLDDVAPEPEARLQIVVDLQADPAKVTYDYPDAGVHDYPNPLSIPPTVTTDHPPQGTFTPPSLGRKK